ncbi:MAG TPA: hypothetical protein VK911_03980 [Vicinamibacterales bacterium]|nr:hypothetical protein [Vicinamibacterales bacterium]
MPRPLIRFGVVVGAAVVVAAAGLGLSAATKPDERVQHLTGAYARAHVAKKEAANHDFRRLRREAAARFEAMGAAPTGELLVVRREVIRKRNIVARIVERVAPTVLASEHWEGGGLEAVFESYYSGTSTQWFGWTYHEQLSDSWWVSALARIDFAPALADPNADPYVLWMDGLETERSFEPRVRLQGPLDRLAGRLFPTLLAQDPCYTRGRQAVRSFIRAGFTRMRADNTYNWMGSIFAGAAGGPAGFAISTLGLFGASYGTGYLDALWNYTKRCPGWYWNPW